MSSDTGRLSAKLLFRARCSLDIVIRAVTGCHGGRTVPVTVTLSVPRPPGPAARAAFPGRAPGRRPAPAPRPRRHRGPCDSTRSRTQRQATGSRTRRPGLGVGGVGNGRRDFHFFLKQFISISGVDGSPGVRRKRWTYDIF